MGENAVPTVHIHYHRPPDRKTVFVQRLVHQTPDVLVTFIEKTPLSRAVVVAGEVVLENDAPAIWFTFPGAWHDIGRFHRADGTFTGIYANILTPVRWLDALAWETTDLFLDLWIDPQGNATVLDEEEWQEAADRGWLDPDLATAARTEALRLLRLAREGAWPPPVVQEWTLERVRRELGRTRPHNDADGGPSRSSAARGSCPPPRSGYRPAPSSGSMYAATRRRGST